MSGAVVSITSLNAQQDGEDHNGDENVVMEIMQPPSAPMAVARRLADGYRKDGCLTHRQWRGGWMQWADSHWVEVEDKAVRGDVYRRLEHAVYLNAKGNPMPWRPNRNKVTDVLDALTAITLLPESVDAPSWLVKPASVPANEIVACTNGLLHVGSRKLLPLTPRYFNRVAVPFDYDPVAPQPTRWLTFLKELWDDDDDDSIAALQEWFGYVLSGRTDLHKILLMVGPTRSGKGTIARVLAALIGKGNAAGPTLASLGTNFGLAPLLGKPLAVVSDARLGSGNEHQVVERLLSISGEDMLTIDRKYREQWTGKLPTRFLILSNELPRFGDASGAIAHRFVVVAMRTSFLGKENTRLTGELLSELPGILSWALDGLDRIANRGVFTEPATSKDAIIALQDLVSPTAAFVRDRCVVGIGYEVPVADLFSAWRSWCDDNGHKPGSQQTFGRDLRAVVASIKVTQPRDGDTRIRMYQGLKLRDEQ